MGEVSPQNSTPRPSSGLHLDTLDPQSTPRHPPGKAQPGLRNLRSPPRLEPCRPASRDSQRLHAAGQALSVVKPRVCGSKVGMTTKAEAKMVGVLVLGWGSLWRAGPHLGRRGRGALSSWELVRGLVCSRGSV